MVLYFFQNERKLCIHWSKNQWVNKPQVQEMSRRIRAWHTISKLLENNKKDNVLKTEKKGHYKQRSKDKETSWFVIRTKQDNGSTFFKNPEKNCLLMIFLLKESNSQR